MRISEQGWCEQADIRNSPHFDERPEGQKISLIVIHNISLPPGCFGGTCVDELFCGCLNCQKNEALKDLEGLRVSSHFFIDRQGNLFQYVCCEMRAWHAGVSVFEGQERCNDFSIGIELEGTDYQPFEEVQYRKLAGLVDALAERYPIQAVTGHSDIAPGRKTDPGPFFDWMKLVSLCNNGKPIRYPYV